MIEGYLRSKIQFGSFILGITILGFVDLFEDWRRDASAWHMLAEALVVIGGIAVMGRLWLYGRMQTWRIRRIEEKLEKRQAELRGFQSELTAVRERVRATIDNQFIKWELTPAERKIAMFMVRGYSFEQIAGLLRKSERTVRQQAQSIYSKTGFANRSEFTGFFLENLFSLDDEPELYE